MSFKMHIILTVGHTYGLNHVISKGSIYFDLIVVLWGDRNWHSPDISNMPEIVIMGSNSLI